MPMDHADHSGLLVLTGAIGDGARAAGASELLGIQPPAEYNADEQRLSVLVQRELDRLVGGGCDQKVLLKLFPRRVEQRLVATSADKSQAQIGTPQSDDTQSSVARQAQHMAWPAVDAGAVRVDTLAQLATEAIGFFGPLHGGVVTQMAYPDVIVQRRRFTTAYPHINLERYEVYDARTRTPALGAWRALRLQNQRRETRTNRMIDMALLALEISQALFPRLLG